MKTPFHIGLLVILPVIHAAAQATGGTSPSASTSTSKALPARSFWNTGALATRSNRMAFTKSMLNAQNWRGVVTNLSHVTTNSPRVVDTQVAKRGPHHKVVRTVRSMIMPDGTTALRTNSYVQLENGMHYLEHGEWKESVAEIEAFPGGAIARRGAHKVIFANKRMPPCGRTSKPCMPATRAAMARPASRTHWPKPVSATALNASPG